MYQIIEEKFRKVPKFQSIARDMNLKITPPAIDEDLMETLDRVFSNLIKDLTTGMRDPHRVRMTIQSPHLGYEIWLPFMKPDELTAERLLAEVEKVIQSNEKFMLDEEMMAPFISTITQIQTLQRTAINPDDDSWVLGIDCVIRCKQRTDDVSSARFCDI